MEAERFWASAYLSIYGDVQVPGVNQAETERRWAGM